MIASRPDGPRLLLLSEAYHLEVPLGPNYVTILGELLDRKRSSASFFIKDDTAVFYLSASYLHIEIGVAGVRLPLAEASRQLKRLLAKQ